jgi:uncharacterized protein (DUF2267 family)
MQYDQFLEAVEVRTGIADRAEAQRTALAVLEALCDRLTGDEADDLLAQLPSYLKRHVTVTRAPMPLTPDALVDRIARELGVSREEARDRVRAVFATIREAVSLGEFRDVLEQLDPGYADLLA